MNDPLELGQFAAVLSQAPWALYAFRRGPDGAMSLPFASEGFGRLFGLEPSSLRGDAAPLLAGVLPGDLARVLDALDRSAQVLSPWREEFGFRRADGGVVWVEASALPSREPDGAVVWRGVCLDVTARHRDEARRVRHHDQLVRLVAQAPVAIAMFDRDLVYLAASRRWAEQLGRGRDDLIGLPHYELFPDVPEHWKEAHRAGLEGEAREAEDDLWVLADGSRRWFRWALHPWYDEDGRVGGITIIGEDVTDRKEAEEAIAASERRYRDLVTLSPDAIFVNRRGRLAFVNDAALRLFAAPSPDALLGRPVLDVIHPDSHATVLARIAALEAGRAVPRELVRVTALDGAVREVEAAAARFVDREGGAVQVVMRDVSEQLRAAQALREEEARFRQLAEAIREVFWMTDVEKQQILYISPGYETIWGRPCASLYATPTAWMDAVHPDDRDRVRRAALTQQVDGGYDIQYRVVRPDGSVRWVHDRAFPVRDDGGRAVRIAGVAEDITDRRRLEEQFQQTQKMESVGRLAGGVAHDFNNLLTIIISSAELMREDPDAPYAGELLDDILDAGRRGASLTRQLLAFTRQEVVEPRVVDLAGVVSDTQKLLRRLIGEDVELSVRLDSAAAPVRVDPGQWTQVLLNLAVNARDAMPTGGTLRIETRAVVADGALLRAHPALREGVYAVLSVTDSGGGMTPEVRARLFEPFFTTKPRGKGTGLGLAVVYGVVHQAGGEIEVDSAPGRGTTFTVYVPAVNAAVLSVPEAFTTSMRPGREVVLLVEDEAAVRRVAGRILTAKGYRVIAAANGREALAALEGYDGPLDLLLTDVVMPALDGAALAREVRARFPEARVLFASGYVDESITLRGVAGEGASFLQKPYSPGVLLQRIREILDA